MPSRARAVIAPAYLFACLILGGSAQGIWGKMVLQLAGIAIIGWAALESDEPVGPAARQLLVLLFVAIAVVALQMIPLPAALWAQLGPRHEFADGFRVLAIPPHPEPLSLTPASGLDALLGLIPPLALFCAMVRLRAFRPQWLAAALIAGTVAGIALGALQVSSSNAELSPWYLYQETNIGKGVGFFANSDHMASLLVLTIPFVAATTAAAKTLSVQRYSATLAVAAGLALLLVVGLALNGSIAGYGLALPVIAASALIVLPPRSRLRLWVVALAALLLIGSVAALEATPIGAGKIGAHATSAVQSRSEILSTTAGITRDFMPFGSGLGSFRALYPLYENPQQVTDEFVVHAHNDYAELILELGLPGALLILLFLAWWAAAVWRAWRTAEAGSYARAATIASAAVLIHSFVDFPLRTAAIAACFGMCLALLANSRAAPPNEKTALRRKRHIEFK